MIKINLPTSEIFKDFSNTKVIYIVCNPIRTYVSIKRFYFNAYKSVPSAAYIPGAADTKFEWGLIETAVSPILYSYNWLRKYRNFPGIIEVKMEDLQMKPKDVMKEVADFMNISFDASLLEASMLGQPYGSNLSSGDNSGGKIVQQNYYDSERYIDEMTLFERWWVQRLFNKAGHESGYAKEIPILELSTVRKFKEFWKPMENEFPSRQFGQNRELSLTGSVSLLIYRWVRSLMNYMINRLFFLIYSESKATLD